MIIIILSLWKISLQKIKAYYIRDNNNMISEHMNFIKARVNYNGVCVIKYQLLKGILQV